MSSLGKLKKSFEPNKSSLDSLKRILWRIIQNESCIVKIFLYICSAKIKE